mmetsp:Transcript_31244/g.94517  ORF Transcript_31244/g.94517 Transcript_31244/m.94517 type:complete len:466 (+) Transcript_31244:124-1521(+)
MVQPQSLVVGARGETDAVGAVEPRDGRHGHTPAVEAQDRLVIPLSSQHRVCLGQPLLGLQRLGEHLPGCLQFVDVALARFVPLLQVVERLLGPSDLGDGQLQAGLDLAEAVGLPEPDAARLHAGSEELSVRRELQRPNNGRVPEIARNGALVDVADVPPLDAIIVAARQDVVLPAPPGLPHGTGSGRVVDGEVRLALRGHAPRVDDLHAAVLGRGANRRRRPLVVHRVHHALVHLRLHDALRCASVVDEDLALLLARCQQRDVVREGATIHRGFVTLVRELLLAVVGRDEPHARRPLAVEAREEQASGRVDRHAVQRAAFADLELPLAHGPRGGVRRRPHEHLRVDAGGHELVGRQPRDLLDGLVVAHELLHHVLYLRDLERLREIGVGFDSHLVLEEAVARVGEQVFDILGVPHPPEKRVELLPFDGAVAVRIHHAQHLLGHVVVADHPKTLDRLLELPLVDRP